MSIAKKRSVQSKKLSGGVARVPGAERVKNVPFKYVLWSQKNVHCRSQIPKVIYHSHDKVIIYI